MGKATDKLNKHGVQALCEDIGNGKAMTDIAERLGVSVGSMLVWVEADSERSARVREARRVMARYWDERAESMLDGAEDEFQLKKAKELSHHYRWRSAKIAPREYGEKVEHEVAVKVTLASLIALSGLTTNGPTNSLLTQDTKQIEADE